MMKEWLIVGLFQMQRMTSLNVNTNSLISVDIGVVISSGLSALIFVSSACLVS